MLKSIFGLNSFLVKTNFDEKKFGRKKFWVKQDLSQKGSAWKFFEKLVFWG